MATFFSPLNGKDIKYWILKVMKTNMNCRHSWCFGLSLNELACDIYHETDEKYEVEYLKWRVYIALEEMISDGDIYYKQTANFITDEFDKIRFERSPTDDEKKEAFEDILNLLESSGSSSAFSYSSFIVPENEYQSLIEYIDKYGNYKSIVRCEYRHDYKEDSPYYMFYFKKV